MPTGLMSLVQDKMLMLYSVALCRSLLAAGFYYPLIDRLRWGGGYLCFLFFIFFFSKNAGYIT